MKNIFHFRVEAGKAIVPLYAVLAAILALSLISAAPPGAQFQAPGPTLDVRAPKRIQLGNAIDLTLTVKHVPDIAGYEVAVLFDTTAAEFGGAEQRKNDLAKIGRAVSPLAAVDLPNGVAVGLFSCPTSDCVTNKGARNDKGGNGAIRLGVIHVYPKEAGTFEIRLGSAKFVDAQGNPFQVAIPASTFTVQVDGEGPARNHPAPQNAWKLPDGPGSSPGPFDLTGDGQVTHTDVMEVALEWETTRLAGSPCAPEDPSRDINHDGCIDVADLQLEEAHLGGKISRSAGGLFQTTAYHPSTVQQASSTFTVNSNGDVKDAIPGDGLCQTPYNSCTLRAAIMEADAMPGPNTINFNIPGGGVKTIKLTGKFPAMNDASGPITIDGYTQPGASPNTDPLADNAKIMIQIEGGGETGFDGFVITTPGNVIRGISIYKVRRSFWIYGDAADNNTVTGSFVGTNAAGVYAAAAAATNAHGFHIEQGSGSNHIGGTSLAERNVISGNGATGVGIWHEASDANVIQNNILGLNPSGTARLNNWRHGLDLNYGSSSNILGGTGPGERNVTSGNQLSGIEISHTTGTAFNSVVGNYIGTDLTGNSAFSWTVNSYTGLTIEDGASNNTITDNVIGNNTDGGIQITGLYTTKNLISNNRVGISLNGAAIGNGLFGIRADGVSNKIGPGNIITNNRYSGVIIRESDKDFNTITQNSIYNNGTKFDLGIDLLPAGVTLNDPGDVDTGPNENLNFPVFSSVSATQVSGTVCASCVVEIFIADSPAGQYGEGKTFVGSATADSGGNFTVPISGVSSGQVLTSTATDPTGNTSEFSLDVTVP